MVAERCTWCSERATGTARIWAAGRVTVHPSCGACRHMMEGHATSHRGVESRNGEATFDNRRRRRGGRGRFRQG